MKKIQLNYKKYPHLIALVDDCMFTRASKHKWYVLDSNRTGKLFYAIARINGKTVLLHRFLFGNSTFDHINGNGLDCRSENLRPCSRKENARNRVFLNNKTGFTGVYKVGKRFQASIRIDGRNKSLGYYATAKAASTVRDEKAREFFGDFYSERGR